ncbi:MAG: 5'-nucleotidase C-terminal domain-containing protein [Firmicutes bacterium]|nr:5'-nucleotidase C-terminal domain-containing protein [Bacillota bacterium]
MSNKNNKNNLIRILSTSDIHGKIYPHSYGDGSPAKVGFARVASKLKELRNDNTLLIDNGDLLVGSPLMIHHMMNYDPALVPSPISKVINKMGYDYINTGNHDYNFGINPLLKHIEATGAVCLTENVSYNGRSLFSLGREDESARYQIREVAGKRIAIFGLVTHFVPRWESEEHLEGLRFFDAFETAKAIISEIKEKGDADYIVCVYHGGFEKDPKSGAPIGVATGENQGYRMLTELPDIDVLITGHQHMIFKGVSKDNTAYTQPGADGALISCIEINPETGVITADLIEVDTDGDEEILALTKDSEDACQQWMDQVIGTTSMDMKITDEGYSRLNKPQLITYINKVQLEYAKGDIAAVALFQGASGFDEDITVRQIVSTYVFPDNLVLKRISGKVLREYIEKDLEYWTVEYDESGEGKVVVNPEYLVPYPQHFNYDLFDGVEYTAKISNPPGSRLISLTREGIPVEDDMEFHLVISNYRSAGGGNFFMLPETETLWQDSKNMIEILVERIMEEKTIAFEPVNNIKIIV